MTHLSWVALHSMTHSFIELHKPLRHDKAVIHEGRSNALATNVNGRLIGKDPYAGKG